MGILSKLNPTADSAKDLNALLSNPVGGTLDWMNKHPVMAKAVSTTIGLAFPPARVALGTAELVSKLKSAFDGKQFPQAVRAWGSTDGQGMSMNQRASAAMNFRDRAVSRERGIA